MKVTVTITTEIEPEEFGRMVASIPPEVRQQFIEASAKAAGETYAKFFTEFMKQAAAQSSPSGAAEFNPFDPFRMWQKFSAGNPGNKDGPS